MTLPLVLTLEKQPELLAAVRAIHRGDDSPIDEVRRCVLDSGACEEVRKLAASKTARALSVLAAVPRSNARSLFEELIDGLSHRNA
jgi:geranylgeranyl pyrophosphate synthase